MRGENAECYEADWDWKPLEFPTPTAMGCCGCPGAR